jgi:hypothetical protein
MESKQHSVVRRHMKLDGVQYELLAISVDEDEYQATWRCPKCNVGGASKLTYTRPEAAIEWARNCAAVHEVEVHGKK